jgi:HEAT repeat protein
METVAKPDYSRVLKQMNGAIRVQEMYPSGHPATLQATEKPFTALQEIFKGTDYLTISQVKDRIIINGTSIEGTSLPERLLEEFKNANINSLTFAKDLTKEELETFLGFFVKPLNQETHPESLPEFLQVNQIGSIKVDQLRYELVSEDEVVVKTEVLEEADLKGEISKIIRDNPELVRDILLNKSPKKESLPGQLGSEIDLHQLTDEVGKQIKNLSDDEVLNLLASGLSQWIHPGEGNLNKLDLSKPDAFGQNPGSVQNEMVDLVHKLLQDREKRKLLHEVKKMLSEHQIVEEKHFDFIFDEKWLKSQAVLDELTKMIERLGIVEVDLEKFMFLWHRVISSQEAPIRLYAIDQLLFKLDSENGQTRSIAVFALKETLSYFIKEKMKSEFTYIQDRLCERIKDKQMSAGILKDYTGLLKVIFFEVIQRGELKEAQKVLLEYNARITSGVEYPQDIKKIAQDFVHEISGESSLSLLTSHLKEGVPSHEIKLVEEILEYLDKDKVAEKLLDIFTISDRTARMSALRVLSRLGKSSVSALSGLLSNPGTLIREKGSQLLEEEQWYKVRNAIYVLGNIPGEESVHTLSKLNSDPDLRVKLEVIKTVEKIGGADSVNVLLTFLNDPEDEVRKNAITSLTRLGDKSCLQSLVEHFRHNQRDKLQTLGAIGKIIGKEPIEDGERSRTTEGGEQSRTIVDSEHSRTIENGERNRTSEFLLGLLWEKDIGIKHLPPKQKDEIKISALNILGKIGSSELAGEIEKFVRQKKKGLRGLLVKDHVIESANRVLKMIKSRSAKTHQETINR